MSDPFNDQDKQQEKDDQAGIKRDVNDLDDSIVDGHPVNQQIDGDNPESGATEGSGDKLTYRKDDMGQSQAERDQRQRDINQENNPNVSTRN